MATNSEKDITMYAVGDIGPDRVDPESIFRHVSGVIKQSDVSFCQLEVNLSHRGIGPMGKENARDPKIASAIKNAGFKVVSFAGNHCLDAGMDAFLDTINNLRERELALIGVGRNIEEARKPAIIDIKGTRIAFLAYNSVLKKDYWAENNRPGCAPLRAWTLYEQVEPDQPGTPCKIHTFSHQGDMKAMVNDIKKAKTQADLVIVSMHAGVHFVPAVIADYQKELAYAAIDSGADLILQHHAHVLKGIEVYSGKVIFYSLCNFALEVHFLTKEFAESPKFIEVEKKLNPDWNPPYPDYPSFPFPPDSRKTIMAKCIISDNKIKKVSFLPVIIDQQGEPEILTHADNRFNEIVDYVEKITRDQGIDTNYTIDGDEIVIS